MVKKNILGVMAIALLFGLMLVSLGVILSHQFAVKIKKYYCKDSFLYRKK